MNIWSYEKDSFERISLFQIPKVLISSVGFSKDDKRMASISKDSIVRLWDSEKFNNSTGSTNSSIKILGEEFVVNSIRLNSILQSIKFSSTDDIFITTSNDNIIRIWDTELNLLGECLGHSDAIKDVNFSPDGQQIVSGSADKSVRLWNLQGEELMIYSGHSAKVDIAKFSPDGKYILSASDDQTARLIPVSIEQVLDKINKEKVRGEVYQLSDADKKAYGIE